MFDFLLYPVSVVLSLCHDAVSLVADPAGGPAWSLSIVLFVVVLRALLVRPALRQLRASRRVQALAPQVAALRERHDGVELARRQAALHRENGISAVGSLLPVLVQIPVVFGLYHVLIRLVHGSSVGALGMVQVQSFVVAHVWGVPLVAGVLAGGAAVAVPLLLLAGVATHLTARVSMWRQPDAPGASGMLRGMALWVFPWSPLVFGLVIGAPTAIALYWATTNVWTLAQTIVLGHYA